VSDDQEIPPDPRATEKDSVAEHAVVCGCHIAAEDCAHFLSVDVAISALGNLWHIDHVCKVKPGARA
jgi:hypothetical protein